MVLIFNSKYFQNYINKNEISSNPQKSEFTGRTSSMFISGILQNLPLTNVKENRFFNQLTVLDLSSIEGFSSLNFF